MHIDSWPSPGRWHNAASTWHGYHDLKTIADLVRGCNKKLTDFADIMSRSGLALMQAETQMVATHLNSLSIHYQFILSSFSVHYQFILNSLSVHWLAQVQNTLVPTTYPRLPSPMCACML